MKQNNFCVDSSTSGQTPFLGRGESGIGKRRGFTPSVDDAEPPGEYRKMGFESCSTRHLSSAGSSAAERVQGNADEVGDSNPSPRPISKFQLRWREPLGRKECPYAYRWTLNLWLFSIRVHQWIRSDDKRHFHDHPWHFITLVLRGSYTDVSPSGRDELRMGSVRFRRATHRHYVEVPLGGALTVILTSPPVRNWGFWVKGVFKRPLRYFGKYGHPPCDDQ
jgi:hypothetical protein